MPLRPRPVLALRTWLALAALVLLAHSLLLGALSGSVRVLSPTPAHRFSTRSIALNAPEPPQLQAKPSPVRRPAAQRMPLAPATPAALSAMPAPATRQAADAGPLTTPTLAAAPEAGEPTRPTGPLRIPGPVRLGYAVTGRQGARTLADATAELLWLQDGQSYQASHRIQTPASTLRTRSSEGRLGTDGLVPLRFADRSRSTVAAHFERDKGTISFSANTADAPLLDGAQDQLSVLLQLSALLAGDPQRYPVATTLAIQTVGPREAEVWLFQVEGDEALALPVGEVSARKLTRQPRRAYDQTVEVWLAPALGYLPVRIRLTESNGNFIDQQLRSNDKP